MKNPARLPAGLEPTTVGLPEPFEQFYVRECPKMVDIAYAMSGSRLAAEVLAGGDAGGAS